MSVLVTGSTGFIAQHIISQLLEQNYSVIGTARSQTKAAALQKLFGNPSNLSIDVVPDMVKPDAFFEIFEKHGPSIKYVMHVASPFFTESDNYKRDLLIPAAEGTKNILEAIKKFGSKTVKHVVITSSVAAMFDFTRDEDPTYTYDEDSWNPDEMQEALIDGGHAYNASKKFAEKLAWKFMEENKGTINFGLTTVCPCYVFGPQQFDENFGSVLNTSCELIHKLVHTSAGAAVDNSFVGNFIDVRDVAKAHIAAIQRPELSGKRLLMISSRFNAQDIYDVMNEDFPELQGNVPKGNPGTGALHHWAGAVADNSRTKELLGFLFNPLRKTIDDTVAQVLRCEK